MTRADRGDLAVGGVDGIVRRLTPGYFALVMASGIISVGLRRQGHVAVSVVLLAVCAAAFVVLVALNAWRVMAHRDAVLADFLDPARGFGFFTFIAGGNVLGVRLAMDGHHAPAAALLAVGVAAWLVLGYVIPWTSVLGRTERPVLPKANGTWFIWVVAGQSVATSSATLQPHLPALRDALAVTAVFAWSVSLFLYAAVGIMVSARLLIYELRPTDLTPPYWVAMGAGAITVLAGARIVEMVDTPMVAATRGLVAGVSVSIWAFATWLIPVLVAAGWWRHRTHRVPLRYEPSLWSMVFPLGMYAVAAAYLGDADDLPLLGQVGAVGIWIAFAVWAVVLAAMVVSAARAGAVGYAERRSDTSTY
ncbi:tellurite resistance/C4-dicarboxylate transporter family protein [Blastococcus sp. CCUG 61487]|uniref:tellurite resistance/C4-dicarboxylate transporter family protein n=1 Tax=Blastococcus sp. CCUG 61487 TaxID=1840703 RepID=UPI00113E90D4|nr:tellurite resistance/C4-dicarboxylate transporter family protein [Blastococcus sp. CCUG 61487]TKJ19835.1 tellurite resistance protein permease [Blastococcus sp. CCUG 61487]